MFVCKVRNLFPVLFVRSFGAIKSRLGVTCATGKDLSLCLWPRLNWEAAVLSVAVNGKNTFRLQHFKVGFGRDHQWIKKMHALLCVIPPGLQLCIEGTVWACHGYRWFCWLQASSFWKVLIGRDVGQRAACWSYRLKTNKKKGQNMKLGLSS